MAKAEIYSILYDAPKCTACRACQVACKEWNQNPGVKTVNRGSYENPPTLGAYTWMRILFNDRYVKDEFHWLFTKHQCMHCSEAACVKVCPPEATTKDENGLVSTDAARCIGCQYCRIACPFDVPGYSEKEKGVFRCTFCVDRVANGLTPACVKTCTAGALKFGPKDELIEEAYTRVAELQANGVLKANVYGESELGGLKYIYVLADEAEAYQLPDSPSIPIGTKVWDALASPWGGVAAAGLVAAAVINGAINARNRGLEEKYKLEKK